MPSITTPGTAVSSLDGTAAGRSLLSALEAHGPLFDQLAAESRSRAMAERPELRALLVIASSSRDPDLGSFVGRAHLGASFIIVPSGASADPSAGDLTSPSAWLGYLTPMERDGAAATGLGLLDPERLAVNQLSRLYPKAPAFWAAILKKGLEIAEIPLGPIAVAGHPPLGTMIEAARLLSASGWHLEDGSGLSRSLRKGKKSAEIAAIAATAAVTGKVFRAVASMLSEAVVTPTVTPMVTPTATPTGQVTRGAELVLGGLPLTVGRVRGEIDRIFAEAGLSQPEGNIVAPGEEGAVPHNIGTDDRRLRSGESLVVDVFPKGLLFADCTRTFCHGQPSDSLLRSHATVLEALRRAHDGAVAGVRGWDLQQACCDYFADLGYDTPIHNPGSLRGYVHGLGHGIGYQLHELPSFGRDAATLGQLEVGDVITLEPGLYDAEAGYGVRLEDLVVISPDGPVQLTPWPYDLDPRAWLTS